MGREDLSTWREMFMKEIGRMTMCMAIQLRQVVDIMQDNGLMTNRMVKAKNYGKMEQIFREIMLMEQNSVKGYTQLHMVLNMWESLQIIAFANMEHKMLRWDQICRVMEVKQISGYGVKIFKFTPRNFIRMMNLNKLENSLMIQEMDMALSITAMEEVTEKWKMIWKWNLYWKKNIEKQSKWQNGVFDIWEKQYTNSTAGDNSLFH
ncbi:unnamed protein product (macronuclear) [Paramecium tetraurelia]|uniref:Uncharacterized protein n=1 Tax=Paramecium tetraurelia TaxID=5888 RepID=A0BH99_PARTE|nr:uncharacterized protein GSPATT00028951001 [Paramecium tetraurelia]CAK57916.1 unnamed protein product [Paramecium tetraurelia]|eukprot:XP_001425314.1 hypothetical protein (macronuclear) [Paramecium tetraurelia strain d4-2]